LKVVKRLVQKNIQCKSARDENGFHSAFTCCDNIIQKLTPLNLKLKADKETDTVNGYITIDHGYGRYIKVNGKEQYVDREEILRDHVITIGIYETGENPNEIHKTTLKKPAKIPTLGECKALLLD